MSSSIIPVMIVILTIVLIVMRFRRAAASKKSGTGESNLMADLAYGFERLRSGVSWRRVDLPDFQVAYLDSHSKGEPVILVHGFGGEKDDWNQIAAQLRKRHHVYAIDLPGAGESSRPSHSKYDPVSQARRLGLFKKKLGIVDKVHLVGIHTGATVAGFFAGVAPNDVKSLTMIEPFGIEVPTKGEVEALAEKGLPALSFGDRNEYDRVQKLLFRNPPPRSGAIVAARIALGRKYRGFDSHVWRDIWSNRPYLLQAVLSEIKVPTLVLWGDSNKVCHQSALPIIEAALPGVTTVQLRGAGHQMIQERPKEVASLLLRFLAGEAVGSGRLEKTMVVRTAPGSDRG
jgi:abhydrolase domain-containing protein 6